MVRKSRRPSKTFLWMVFAKDMRKSKNFDLGIDFAAGYMENYPFFRTKNYLGIDIDLKRLKTGNNTFPHAKFLKCSIEDTPPDILGDFIVCVQTLGINKHFTKRNTFFCVQKLINATSTNGNLLFNVNVMGDEKIEARIDKILSDNFKNVKKIEYGRFNSKHNKNIAFILAALMFVVSPLRKNTQNKCLYYFSENRV